MTGLYAVEVEPEVRGWLTGLSDRDFGRVDFLAGLLAEQADDPRLCLKPGTWAARPASCASTCSPSKPGSPTG